MAFALQALSRLTLVMSMLKPIAQLNIFGFDVLDWTVRFRQTAPPFGDSSQFDPARWDHYTLIIVFFGIASWGLWLSWSWNQEKHQGNGQTRLTKESRKE